MSKQTHRPEFDHGTFNRLDIYRAKHDLSSSNAAVEHLLDRVEKMGDE